MPNAAADLFLERITNATKALDREEVERTTEELIRHLRARQEPFPTKTAEKILGALRTKRHFDLMEQLSEELIERGAASLRVRRQGLQALIDQGRLTSARDAAEDLVEAAAADASESAEARGLRGRVLKQIYVNAGDRPDRGAKKALAQAIDSYYEVYRENPDEHYWHGINVVACLARAERDGVSVFLSLDWRATAREILDRIAAAQAAGSGDTWRYATALEACVALDDFEQALAWEERYLPSKGADAFELASTHRQMVEVWQLDRDPGGRGAAVLKPLVGAWGSAEGRELDIVPGELSPPVDLQSRWGDYSARSASFYDKLMRRMESVARVEDSAGRAKATAFVVRGEDLAEKYRGRKLILTNVHVVDEVHPKAIRPGNARLRFTRLLPDDDERFRVKKVWGCADLDVCLLEAQIPDKIRWIQPAPRSDLEGPDGGPMHPLPPLPVIGHPKGADELKISLRDSYLTEIDRPFVYYRSPTESGSSGSPVLTEELYVVAVHRGAVDERKANQGALLDEVRGRLANS